MTDRPRLDFWFELASTYSYPAAMRVDDRAAAAGVEVRWRPFLLGPTFKALGWPQDSPFNWQEAKGRHMQRDLTRLCEGLGLGFKIPDPFPQPSLMAARIAAAGLDEPWLPDFVRAVYSAQFAEGRQIHERDTLAEILKSLGVDADAAFDTTQSDDNKARLRALTEEATSKGVFGAPTFITADGEVFWGHDRMDHALHWARNGTLEGLFVGVGG
ncbi:MAG: 2-hydroxychromene-2-carboxylate isomerase [Pseudomonadota bacterium]